MNYKSRKEKRAISLVFSARGVRKASVSPKKKIKRGTVALKPDHRRDVIDPVSALVFAVDRRDIGDGYKICDRTLPLFDGVARYNLKMTYNSAKGAQTGGFSGEVFTCNVRYQPIAGHRPHKKNVKFLIANRDIQITLARIGETNTYGLFAFRVKTRKGVLTGRASLFATR